MAALDGSGPAIAPVDAGLPPARLAGLIDALGPGSVEDTEGVTSARSGPYEGVAEGTAGGGGAPGGPRGAQGGGGCAGAPRATAPAPPGPGGGPAPRGGGRV